MAELVLSKVGEIAGQSLLPKGLAFLGATAGRIAGASIDARFLTPPAEGPRIPEFHLTEGREGAGIPIVYGRSRIGSQLLWAAAFKERREVEGGKGGPRVADYAYSLSFAVGLCEGEVARVSRCWANGVPFDLSQVTWRFYPGTDDQAVDPLIEAIEGEAPAYRGLAYIVFEDMPVDAFGGRMPQLSFEVVRPASGDAGRMEAVARSVNIIPGSGEFSLATEIVRRQTGPGRETAENLHGPELKSDFEASLDQLAAELPNVSRVNLVVAWFGTDLRCGECAVVPGVELSDKATAPQSWSVAGVTRAAAHLVSQTDGRANYGGTPGDTSVRQAIAMLKARGYHVTLYPFLLMDIPPGNDLPDPHGGEEQPAFPWRGRITTTAGDASAQIAAFFEEYRSFVLHYAALAAEANADGILIGSELVGLTRIADAGVYPAVDALCVLAADVRAEVGPDVEISYAADWTEYGAHVVGDEVAFPLDVLWANAAISYVGLDWYPPMADSRGDEGRSTEHLSANVAGGEAYDWYYADADARIAQARTPITDGAYDEPWVFRQKDVKAWWENDHYPRVGGIRSDIATDWVAGMKPVRFVEMGVPALNQGANQPNVFYDPKSSESALPWFSDGSRDDIIQRRAIEAFHAHWSAAANNPASSVYDGRMLPEDGIALWAWDARPYPAFPALEETWSDAGNWRLGHWLNGRAGAALLSDVVADICARAGAVCETDALVGVVSGYVLPGPAPARRALEPLTQLYGIDATERDGAIVLRMRTDEAVELDPARLVEDRTPAIGMTREGLEQDDVVVQLRFVDVEADYQPGLVRSTGLPSALTVQIEAPIALDRGQAERAANDLAVQIALRRERAEFAMSADGAAFEAGDVVALGDDVWRIVDVSDGKTITFSAARADVARPVLAAASPAPGPPIVAPATPDVVIVDAPPMPGEEDDLRPISFAFAEPWTGPVDFRAGADLAQMTERGRVQRPCAMGRLISDLWPHVSGRWQETSLWVTASGPAPASASVPAVLNGANRALVETEAGWELIQFQAAELVDVETYRLSGLLRGQQGSEDAMKAGAPVGSRIVFLTGAEQRLDVADWERGLALEWAAGGWASSLTHSALAARPWSPAHLRADWGGGDILLSWVRRARRDGDRWTPGEPMLEGAEAYRIRISGGESVREWDVAVPSSVYAAAMHAADFPSGGEALIEVAQLGPDGQPGGWEGLAVAIPAP